MAHVTLPEFEEMDPEVQVTIHFLLSAESRNAFVR